MVVPLNDKAFDKLLAYVFQLTIDLRQSQVSLILLVLIVFTLGITEFRTFLKLLCLFAFGVGSLLLP